MSSGDQPTAEFFHCVDLKLDEDSQFRLMVSHIESPSLFYVFPIDQVGSVLHELESNLCKYYADAGNCELLDSKNVKKGTPCCMRNMENGVASMYRGMITSSVVSRDSGTEKCSILCVDYGWTLLAPLHSVYELAVQFFAVPVLVTACSLLGVIPKSPQKPTDRSWSPCSTTVDSGSLGDLVSSGSSSNASPPVSNDVSRTTCEWSQDVSDRFSTIIHDKILVGVVYEKEKAG